MNTRVRMCACDRRMPATETPGEDPYLTQEYAYLFVTGFQGGERGEEYLKASACCKHFAVCEYALVVPSFELATDATLPQIMKMEAERASMLSLTLVI
eukprot:SAG25_NODE_87_length_16363_cov_40.489179_7_plen_98_part_00